MWSSKQRQTTVRLFLWRLGMLALLALIVISAPSVWGVYKKERESATRRVEAEERRNELIDRGEQLEGDIARLRTDRGLEETLREQYALAEEGEKLIVIVDPKQENASVATTSSPWWQRFLSWW